MTFYTFITEMKALQSVSYTSVITAGFSVIPVFFLVRPAAQMLRLVLHWHMTSAGPGRVFQ